MIAINETGVVLCSTEAALAEASTLAANLEEWRIENARRIAEHAKVRAKCRTCRVHRNPYGCDACNTAIAHIGVAHY